MRIMKQAFIIVKDDCRREPISHLCTCPNKHTLERHEVGVPKSAWLHGSMCSHSDHSCAVCRFTVPQGHVILRCDKCEFDLCDRCLSQWPSPTVLKVGSGHCGCSNDSERKICADVSLNPECCLKTHFWRCHMCEAKRVVKDPSNWSELMTAAREIQKKRDAEAAARQKMGAGEDRHQEPLQEPLRVGKGHCGCEWYGNTCASEELNPAWIGKRRFFRCHSCEAQLLVERGGPKCGVPGHKCGIGDAKHCGQSIRYPPWHVLIGSSLVRAISLMAGTSSGE